MDFFLYFNGLISDSLDVNGPHEDNSGSIRTGPFQNHPHHEYSVTKEKRSGPNS